MLIGLMLGGMLLGCSLLWYEFHDKKKQRTSQEKHLQAIQHTFKVVDTSVDLELATFPQIVGELSKRRMSFCIIQPGPNAKVSLVSLGIPKPILIELLDMAKEELGAGHYE